jgi:hypothetical protein
MGSTTSNNNINSQTSDVTKAVFNKANYIFILWFLAIYVLAYYLVGLVFKKSVNVLSFPLRISRGIDFLVLVSLLIFLFVSYFNNTEPKREDIYQDVVGGYSNFINNPTSIITILFCLIVFYIIIFLFRIPTAADVKPVTVSLLETAGWTTFVVICFVDFFKYVLQLSLTSLVADVTGVNNLQSTPSAIANTVGQGIVTANNAVVSGINILDTTGNLITGKINNGKFTNTVKGNISGNLSLSQPEQKKEVFNISNNLYTYEDAQAICSAYGAELATYDQIESAYNDGGEWCNYGWSDGQMAFFPTQKSTWEKLQKSSDHKNDCGRPGINGGYFANPYIKFGVNCYGKKPAPSPAELAHMAAANKDLSIPQTANDVALNGKVNFWKQNAGNLLVINSFDRTKWSEY